MTRDPEAHQIAQRSMMLVAQVELLVGQLEQHTQKLSQMVDTMVGEDADNERWRDEEDRDVGH